MNRLDICIDHGNRWPYDAPDSYDESQPLPPKDWAHSAARGVINNLQDRRGIKNGFDDVDEDTRVEIVASLAEIIRISERAGKGDGKPK